MIELTFLKELMLIKLSASKELYLSLLVISYIIVLSFNKMSAIDVMIY